MGDLLTSLDTHLVHYQIAVLCKLHHMMMPCLLTWIHPFSFSFSLSLLLSGIVSPSCHHHLHSIRCYSTSIQLLLTWINFIITISICLSTWICSDCFYHAGISLILTLLSCSTSIEPWDKSMLTPTTTNCSTWASTYRSAPPPSYYQQCLPRWENN